jgi:hypothetical protein
MRAEEMMLVGEVFHTLVVTFGLAEVDQLARDEWHRLAGDSRHRCVVLPGAVTAVAGRAGLEKLLPMPEVSSLLEH